MQMKDVIREKRKELSLTQEQIASRLGVSTPAVNKWENGLTYPDVTLLPALARLLKTDLNTLLCFRTNMSTEEIALFLNEIAEIAKKEGVKQAAAVIKEKIKEFPACAELLYQSATFLQGFALMYPCPEEERKLYMEYVQELYQRVEQCGNPVYENRARYMLASASIQAEDYERAQELLDLMPENDGLDKNQLMITMWMNQGKNEEAAKLLERKINIKIQEVFILLNGLASVAVREGDRERAWKLAEYSQKLTEIYGWSYSGYVVPLTVALEEKDADRCAGILEDIMTSLEGPINFRNSVIFAHMNAKEKKGGEMTGKQFQEAILAAVEKDEQFSFLRENASVRKLLDKYRGSEKLGIEQEKS